MASFLMNCPQCNVMIAPNHPCPDCRWTEQKEQEDGAPPGQGLVREFAVRESAHKRNYFIFMGLILTTGLIGLLTSILWIRFIYLGSVNAFFLILLLTIVTAGLGVALKFSKRFFPVDLNCPACDIRLDQLELSGNGCPACSVQLK